MTFLNYFLFLILFLVFIFSFIYILTPLFSKVPFIPVRKRVLKDIINSLELTDDSVLYDLGCGNGRVLFTIARKNPKVSCFGIEKAPFPYIFAKFLKFLGGFKNVSKNVSIVYGDMFKKDVSCATHVFLYLLPEIMDEFLPKLEKELKSGTRVVSCDFYFSKKKPDRIIDLNAKGFQMNKKLYIYIF